MGEDPYWQIYAIGTRLRLRGLQGVTPSLAATMGTLKGDREGGPPLIAGPDHRPGSHIQDNPNRRAASFRAHGKLLQAGQWGSRGHPAPDGGRVPIPRADLDADPGGSHPAP